MIGERAPALAEACVRQLEGRDTALEATCLRSAAVARNLLQAEGWQECPSWRAIADGARPPAVMDRGLGDWPHGWQHSALLPGMPPSSCALLRSQANRHPGRASHNTVPARNAACLASPFAPPAPPPSKAVRPLSRLRRARRRLRRPCPGLPSHWALGSASKDRRTGVGEGRARSRWGRRSGSPAAMALQHHCSWRCARRQTPS